MNTIYLY